MGWFYTKDGQPAFHALTKRRFEQPSDDASCSPSTASDSSETEKPLEMNTSVGLPVGSVLPFANGDLVVSSDTRFLTLEEELERRSKGRQSEAQRLKERLSSIPWHAQRAAVEGETYWLRLAESYQGD